MKSVTTVLHSVCASALLGTSALMLSGSAIAEELTVAYFLEWPTPNQYAQAKKIYDKELGIDVKWVAFDAGTAMSAAMASGDVQISFSQGIPPFVVAASAGQDPEAECIDHEAAGGDHEHDHPLHLGGRAEALDRLDRDQQGDGDQRGALRERSEDLGARVSVGALRARRSLCDPDREQCEHQRGDVREHVPGVGKQRQRARDQAAHDLGQHVDGGERQHEAEPARVRLPGVVGPSVAGMAVRVDVSGATVREILAEMAQQAQLGIVVERGYVRVLVVPE